MVKCIKLYLIYRGVAGISYPNMCKELWQLQDEIRAAKNKAVSILYENLMWKMEQKRLTGAYPDETERYGDTLRNYLYRKIIEAAPSLQTANAASAQQALSGKFKKSVKALLKGEKSLDSFKAGQPIDLHNSTIHFSEAEDKLFVELSLFSKEKRKALGMKDGKVPFEVWKADSSQKQIIQRCLSGTYKHGAGSLSYDKKKKMWVLAVSYHFEPAQPELNPERICGVDLGIAAPVYCAVSDGYSRLHFPGGKIEQFSRQIERRRRELLKSRPFCGDGSQGHGYKKRVQPVEVLAQKISNFRDTQNDLMSRAVVNFAVRNQCGTIQMENLTGIAESDVFLKRWSYYDLQTKIEQKAAEAGIAVKKINPQYTSQRCSKCGFIDKENRKKQKDFKCLSCGYAANADYNAAKNIAISNIEDIIKQSLRANSK